MIDITWSQISRGLVGGFSGFLANIFQEHKPFRRVRRSVACALVGEIDALRQHIEDNSLAKLRAEVQSVGPNNRARHLVERFFNRIRQCRRIANR